MRKLVSVFLLVILTTVVNAQYTKKIFFMPEWTVGVNGGLNYYLGEGYQMSIKSTSIKPLSSFGRISIGYKLSTLWSVRTTVGMNNYSSEYIKDSILNFNSQNLMLDFSLNLMNFFSNYKVDRDFYLSAFAGCGISHRNNIVTEVASIDTKSRVYPIARAGLQADFRLTELLYLNAMGEINIVDDNFNGIVQNVKVDVIPAISVGLSYKILSKSYKVRTVKVQ